MINVNEHKHVCLYNIEGLIMKKLLTLISRASMGHITIIKGTR
jgi:hypothetical protein